MRCMRSSECAEKHRGSQVLRLRLRYDVTMHQSGPIVLFDGVCNLCNASVQWIITHDRDNVFRFASLQSEFAKQELARRGVSVSLSSVIVLDGERLLSHSDAAIAVAGALGLPWSLARGAKIVPRFIRDGVYNWIAKNRYRCFGTRDACMMPTPELRERFLDSDQAPKRE